MAGQELFDKNGRQVNAFFCEKCGIIYNTKEQADDCYNCIDKKIVDCACGRGKKFHWETECQLCQEDRRFEAAENVEEWDGWLYDPNSDFFYTDLEELLFSCEDNNEIPPKYVYTCTTEDFVCPDISDFMAWIDENNSSEDMSDSCEGVKELDKAIQAFERRNNHLCSYVADFTKVLVIK